MKNRPKNLNNKQKKKTTHRKLHSTEKRERSVPREFTFRNAMQLAAKTDLPEREREREQLLKQSLASLATNSGSEPHN